MSYTVGLVGKPSVGKSTFFNAATMNDVPEGAYPFTTIDPSVGEAYVRVTVRPRSSTPSVRRASATATTAPGSSR